MPQTWNIPEPGAQPPGRHRSRRSVVIQGAILLGLWLIFSGHYDVFHISMGVLSVALIMLLNRSLFSIRLFPGDVHRQLQIRRMLPYAVWLVKEVLLAALQVARIVLSPRRPVDPSLLGFYADLPNAGSQTILANSITLTPGTITIDITHGRFLVHAISDGSSQSLVDGIMPARVARLYEGTEDGAVTDITVTKQAAE